MKSSLLELRNIFLVRPNLDIVNQLYFIHSYPTMFTNVDNDEIDKFVSLEEIFEVLRYFFKDKCHGLDGWAIEVFLQFLEIMEMDLSQTVEESKLQCKVAGVINSNFIAPILKSSRPKYFIYYHPIS